MCLHLHLRLIGQRSQLMTGCAQASSSIEKVGCHPTLVFPEWMSIRWWPLPLKDGNTCRAPVALWCSLPIERKHFFLKYAGGPLFAQTSHAGGICGADLGKCRMLVLLAPPRQKNLMHSSFMGQTTLRILPQVSLPLFFYLPLTLRGKSCRADLQDFRPVFSKNQETTAGKRWSPHTPLELNKEVGMNASLFIWNRHQLRSPVILWKDLGGLTSTKCRASNAFCKQWRNAHSLPIWEKTWDSIQKCNHFCRLSPPKVVVVVVAFIYSRLLNRHKNVYVLQEYLLGQGGATMSCGRRGEREEV